MKFGEFIRQKRLDKGMGLRECAEKIGIAASYMSDIEKGNRNAPNEDIMVEMIDVLDCFNADYFVFHDLAAETHNDIPLDIKMYLLETKEEYTSLRKKIYTEPVVEQCIREAVKIRNNKVKEKSNA
jgi:transcriptional regulator with XRE-family HTH domain